jgi:hypothetical protein
MAKHQSEATRRGNGGQWWSTSSSWAESGFTKLWSARNRMKNIENGYFFNERTCPGGTVSKMLDKDVCNDNGTQ